jgi:hypothetical protein
LIVLYLLTTFQGEECKATFTELHLDLFDHGSPYGLKNFLQCPQSLEIFTLGTMGMCGYSLEDQIEMGCMAYPWTFPLLREALVDHCSTLRELRVRQLGPAQEGLSVFDLHEFSNLEIFQIAQGGMPSPKQACKLWLTPRLKRLSIECSFNDSQHGIVWINNDNMTKWLEEFARLAAVEKKCGDIGLCEIEIQFVPDFDRMSECTELANTKSMMEAYGFQFICPPAVLEVPGHPAESTPNAAGDAETRLQQRVIGHARPEA